MRPNATVHMMDEEFSLIYSSSNFCCITQGQTKIFDLGGNRTHDLRIRSPEVVGSTHARREPWERGCLRTTFVYSEITQFCFDNNVSIQRMSHPFFIFTLKAVVLVTPVGIEEPTAKTMEGEEVVNGKKKC